MSQLSFPIRAFLAASAAVVGLAFAPVAHADPGNHHSTSQGKHLGQAKSHGSLGHHVGAGHSSGPNSGHHAKGGHRGKSAEAPGHTKTPGSRAASPSRHPQGHGTKDAAGDPPGNNGTVKISLIGDHDGTPNNVPHPGCAFEVQWYGYDAGAHIISTVAFAPQAPTKDVTIGVNGPTRVKVGGDRATGAGTATGLDAVRDYTLSFSDGTPAKQGYHVRVTVSTPHSLGNDTKTKVFWVEPCTTRSGGGDTRPSRNHGSVSAEHVTRAGLTAHPVTAAAPSARGVPTSIEAGVSRHGLDAWVHSPWPLVIAGLGALLAAMGVARMRRRV